MGGAGRDLQGVIIFRCLEKNGRPEKKMGFHEGPLSPYQFALNLDEPPFCTAQC